MGDRIAVRHPLGKLRGCPAAASDANGAGVIAGATDGGVRASLREPGGAWSAPITLAAREPLQPEVAISARGDAVVAWPEPVSNTQSRIRVARRPGRGVFGAAQQIARGNRVTSVAAAVTGAGEAIVLTAGDGGCA